MRSRREKPVSVSSNSLALKRKYLREDLALLAEIAYIIYMKERVARAMVAEKEVRFLYELCCSGEKQGLLAVE